VTSSSSTLVTRVSYSAALRTLLSVKLFQPTASYTSYSAVDAGNESPPPVFVAIATSQGRLGSGSLMCDGWRTGYLPTDTVRHETLSLGNV
jgi:hypothetical protein